MTFRRAWCRGNTGRGCRQPGLRGGSSCSSETCCVQDEVFQCSYLGNGTIPSTSAPLHRGGALLTRVRNPAFCFPKIQHSARSFVLTVSWVLPRLWGSKTGMRNPGLGPAASGWGHTEGTIAQPRPAKCPSSETPSQKHHTLKKYEGPKGLKGQHGYKVLEDLNSSPNTHVLW